MVDAATTSEAVGFITLMQELKRKLRSWEQQVEVYRGGEKILDRQRFQFPTNWIYVDNVEGGVGGVQRDCQEEGVLGPDSDRDTPDEDSGRGQGRGAEDSRAAAAVGERETCPGIDKHTQTAHH